MNNFTFSEEQLAFDSPALAPDDVRLYLNRIGLLCLDEHREQMKKLLKRQRQPSVNVTNVQNKSYDNGLKDHKQEPLPSRKRTSFSPVVTRKRGRDGFIESN
ncbi:unnamed protein product [Didymodactylos carnosus]|uniref:Uncharacterized protein n=1 Tax=Didymodactylos carnosus TaxID=1234261 RepID=A0A813YSZ1_9BILA|nr:unnamed protein product [Didymodactylos carnosus]CAF1556121.1 unnamed protein product [Didymodactylos carnosus]CAF3673696.1 unnamed protein product [Didymodactylos carnosus]CAF4347125.1 unnamed protein product [Didymodactylos carnosus]